MLPLLAWPDWPSAALGATRDFHHGLLEPHRAGSGGQLWEKTSDHSAAVSQPRRSFAPIQVAVVRDERPTYRRDKSFCYKLGDTVVPVGDRDAPDRAPALFRRA